MTSETPGEKAEKARVRRRWLTLGEILAVAAVAISALTFWNSYRERTDSEANRQAESAKANRAAAILVLTAKTDDDGKVLTLGPRLDSQSIQDQRLTFPTVLGLAAVETSGNPRIERGWFEDALVAARRKAGKADDAAGDARLPVMIATNYLVDGEPHTDRAVYEVGYAMTHGLLGGAGVKLRGLSRVGPVASEAAGRKRVDTLAGGLRAKAS